MSLLKAVLSKPKNRAPIIGQELTPAKLKQAYTSAQAGNPAAYFGMLEFLLGADDEIPSAMQQLSSAVLEIGPTFTELEESEAATAQAVALEEIFREMDIVALLESLIESHYYGFRAVELKWNVATILGKQYQVPTRYELLPLSWLEAKKEKKDSAANTLHIGDVPWYQYPRGFVPLMTAGKMPSYTDLDFTKFGKGYGVARLAIFKYYAFGDWAAFLEKYGIATLIGKLKQGFSTKDEELLVQALNGISSDSSGYVTDVAEITPLDVNKAGTSDSYDLFIDTLNKAISKIIKSESLTDNQGKNGSRSASETANGIKVTVARKIATKLETLIARHIVQPIADLNWGGKVLVKVQIPVREVANLVEETKIDTALLGAGLELSKSELRDRYGRTAPADPADMLTKAPALNLFGA